MFDILILYFMVDLSGSVIISMGKRDGCFAFRCFVKYILSDIVCLFFLWVSLVGYILYLCRFLDMFFTI